MSGSEKPARLNDDRKRLLEMLTGGDEGSEPIAIVGVGCRFPGGADSLEKFWQNLCNGIDAVTEIPPERWSVDGYYAPAAGTPGKSNSRWAGLLTGLTDLDAKFFGITPREAPFIDPQQRLALETAFEAFESAGIPVDRLEGTNTGVFLGISQHDYSTLGALLAERSAIHSPFSGTGAATSVAANRISYSFDLRGPSIGVDTACSASLVAIHLACESLRRSECDLAIAGGVNAILLPEISVRFSNAGLFSPDGRCKAFDASANGYVRGEGAAFIVLKPFATALADGDRILALVRGSAVNQDGRTNGLTAPNRHAQEAVLRQAYANAGIRPAQVQYIEAHGSGTPLGDPIECAALGAVLAEGRERGDRCALGSVKTNLGHLEAAAGMAGIVKTVLALRHRRIPPNLHFHNANPHIPFDTLPLRVVDAMSAFPKEEEPLYAGVSSFSFGGTNAHVVLAEAPVFDKRPAPTRAGRQLVLPLSARSAEALAGRARSMRDHLLALPPSAEGLEDVVYTAAVRRAHFDHRLAVVGATPQDLASKLDELSLGMSPKGAAHGVAGATAPRIVFVFQGQGGQRLGMGRELLRSEPAFRDSLERTAEHMSKYAAFSLFDELEATEATSRLGETQVMQPVLFAIEIAIADLLRHYGIVPDVVIGHSMGEVAALVVAEAISLEDGVRIMCTRARLMQGVAGRGGMAMVDMTFEEALELLEPYGDAVSIGASNGHRSTVLSGDNALLRQIVDGLNERGVFAKQVRMDVASHSVQVEPLRDAMLRELADVSPMPPRIPFLSTTCPDEVAPVFDASYWWKNLRDPVMLYPRIRELLESQHELFVEIGPHPVLAGSIADSIASARSNATVLGTLRRDTDDGESILEVVASAFCRGARPSFARVVPPGRVVDLPCYPWQRERAWIGDLVGSRPGGSRHPRAGRTRGEHPFLEDHIELAQPRGVHVWETELDADRLALLQGYRELGRRTLPLVTVGSLGLAAAAQAFPDVRDIAVKQLLTAVPLTLARAEPRTLQVVIAPIGDEETRWTLTVASRPAGSHDAWADHVSADLTETLAEPIVVRLNEVRARCREIVSASDFYDTIRQRGTTYDSTTRLIATSWRGDHELIAELDSDEVQRSAFTKLHVRPVLLDACTHALVALVRADDGGVAFVARAVGSLWIADTKMKPRWLYAKLRDRGSMSGSGAVLGDVWLLDATGEAVAELRGVRLEPAPFLVKSLAPRASVVPSAPEPAAKDDIVAKLAAAPAKSRGGVLEAWVLRELAHCLRMPPAQVGVGTNFRSLGLQSLGAVELRNRIEQGLRLQLALGTMWGYPTAAALARHLLGELGYSAVRATSVPPPPSSLRSPFDAEAETRRISIVSEDEARSALEDELAAYEQMASSKRD